MSENYKRAPEGFTEEQWSTFMDDGFIAIENAISPTDIETYLEAIDRVVKERDDFDGKKGYGSQNIVTLDPTFAELIDNARHVGFAYDLYGEQLKLQSSTFMMRPKGSRVNQWHPDGPRPLPYNTFSPVLPLQLRIGYWLTDLPEQHMGNFVYLPGSHHQQYLDAFDTHDTLEGEAVTNIKAGTMTLMHNALWHRVQENNSDVIRKNIFVTYCPSWIVSGDRHRSKPEFLETLNREQRILMRDYWSPYLAVLTPEEDFPMYLDRETGADRDRDKFREEIILERRKRETQAEQRLNSE